MPLPLAGLDRKNGWCRTHLLDAEEGMLARQLRMQGVLRHAQKRVLSPRGLGEESLLRTSSDGYIRWYNEKRMKISTGGMIPFAYRRGLGVAS